MTPQDATELSTTGGTSSRLGVRVPSLLVSPWVNAGVLSTELDHTSVLKYLIEKWTLGWLGDRAARANSIAQAIRTTGQPRADTPASIEVPLASLGAAPPENILNDHQRALIAFSEYLEREIEDTPERKLQRRSAMMAGPQSQETIAEERAWRFIEQQKAQFRGGPAGDASSS